MLLVVLLLVDDVGTGVVVGGGVAGMDGWCWVGCCTHLAYLTPTCYCPQDIPCPIHPKYLFSLLHPILCTPHRISNVPIYYARIHAPDTYFIHRYIFHAYVRVNTYQVIMYIYILDKKGVRFMQLQAGYDTSRSFSQTPIDIPRLRVNTDIIRIRLMCASCPDEKST